MSGRGTANLLTRTTAFLAVGFFLTSLLLSWLAGYDRKPASILDTSDRRRSPQPAAPATPIAPPQRRRRARFAASKQRAASSAAGAAGPQAPRSQ